MQHIKYPITSLEQAEAIFNDIKGELLPLLVQINDITDWEALESFTESQQYITSLQCKNELTRLYNHLETLDLDEYAPLMEQISDLVMDAKHQLQYIDIDNFINRFNLNKSIEYYNKAINFITSPIFPQIKELLPGIEDYIKDVKSPYTALINEFIDHIDDLLPLIKSLVKEYQNNYNFTLTFETFISPSSDDKSLLEIELSKLPTYEMGNEPTLKDIDKAYYPYDLVNRNAFKELKPGVTHPIHNKKDNFNIYFKYDNFRLSNNVLNATDKLIYNAICDLYIKGVGGLDALTKAKEDNIHKRIPITPAKIYALYKGIPSGRSPNQDQLNITNDILDKLQSTKIWVDNTEETKKYKKSNLIVCDQEPLLDFTKRVYINKTTGKVDKCEIIINKEPLLLRIAREKGQITVISREAGQPPKGIKATQKTDSIRSYIMDRVFYKKANNKILLTTFFEECKIPNKARSQDQALKVAKQELDHLVKNGELLTYDIKSDCITFKRTNEHIPKIIKKLEKQPRG